MFWPILQDMIWDKCVVATKTLQNVCLNKSQRIYLANAKDFINQIKHLDLSDQYPNLHWLSMSEDILESIGRDFGSPNKMN